jgi:hypothetical protein
MAQENLNKVASHSFLNLKRKLEIKRIIQVIIPVVKAGRYALNNCSIVAST